MFHGSFTICTQSDELIAHDADNELSGNGKM